MDFKQQARKVIERSEELEHQLQNPDILSDKSRMAETSRLHKSLAQTVEKAREYLALLAERAEWEKAAADPSDAELQQLAQDEVKRLAEAVPALEAELRILFIPKDPNDERGAILEIRAGTGGDEASIFAGDLYRMYRYYIESRGWRITVVSESEGTAGGYKEIMCEVDSSGAYGVLKYESGVHRVQRVPATEAQGRVHTSAASVVVMPMADDMDAIDIRDEDIRVDTYRAGGAGGQHINKTDSAVRITHLPTGLVVACQDERSQHKNRSKAMNLLKSRLLDAQIAEREAKEAAARKSQVGTGDRSAKIRTYNFPQGRCTDHRVNLTLYKLDAVMKGDIQELIDALVMEANAEKLRDLE
ncbi:MAG TPA: peptide chain release factor 1, partial [Fibrobacteria bacterium]|nr:peptide chain release factor 1 [Fibrobacteria bacterium]